MPPGPRRPAVTIAAGGEASLVIEETISALGPGLGYRIPGALGTANLTFMITPET